MLELLYFDIIGSWQSIPTGFIIEIKESTYCLSGMYTLFAQAANISIARRAWHGKLSVPCR